MTPTSLDSYYVPMSTLIVGENSKSYNNRRIVSAVILSAVLVAALLVYLVSGTFGGKEVSPAAAAPSPASVHSPPHMSSPHVSSRTGVASDPPYQGCTADTIVHVVFSNHFDLGYRAYQPDGDFAWQVMNQTMHVWLPRALQYEKDMLAMNQTQNPYNDTFTWMTQPYILSNALDCPPYMNFTCLDNATRAAVLDAMQRGMIWWHAFPYNSEAELHTQDLYEYGIELSHALSDLVGLPRPMTISQRDVPGTTQAMIPLLIKHGIRAFSIGANGWPSNADAYGHVFRWRASADPAAEEIILLYHDGYGGIDVHDAVIIDGFNHILITDWATDNQGPQTAQSYINDLAFIRQQFPKCTVKTSTFDDFVTPLFHAIQRGQVNNIPIVTAEMGDQWIYGASSDPLKMAKFRALERLRTSCLRDADCDHESYAFKNFSRWLMKSAEHTWGDYGNPNYSIDIATWVEQRIWGIDVSLQALPANHPIQLAAPAEFAAILPKPPDLSNYQQLFGADGGKLQLGDWAVTIANDGSINNLVNMRTGKQYASPGSNSFGLLLYQLWSGKMSVQKGNQPAADPYLTRQQTAILSAVYISKDSQSTGITRLWLQSHLTADLVQQYGGWQEAWVHIDFDSQQASVDYVVQLWGKNATRTPEGAFFVFSSPPPMVSPLVNKLGQWVDVGQIITGGGRHIHGADFPGVRQPGLFTVSSLDIPFVSVGYVTPLPYPLGPFPDMANARNISWSVVNNVWFTNYPQSYPYLPEDKDIQSRLHLQLMQ